MKNKCADHHGTAFPSERAMAAAWGITYKAYIHRRNAGWELQKTLETPGRIYHTTDHKGREYRSKNAMCAAYGIKFNLYLKRRRRGMSLQEALETPAPKPGRSKMKPCEDHKGNKYPSKTAMAEAYGIRILTLNARLRRGKPLKEALEEPVKHKEKKHGQDGGQKAESISKLPRTPIKDHLGNEYRSKTDMARAYGLKPGTLNERLRCGKPLKEALEEPVRHREKKHGQDNSQKAEPILKSPQEPIKDHLGNEYRSKTDMARAYELEPGTLRRRLRSGKSLKEALETPVDHSKRRKQPPVSGSQMPCADYKGNVYKSKKEMLKAYGLTRQAYHQRLKKGMTPQEALETPPGSRNRAAYSSGTPSCSGATPIFLSKICKDHKGRQYPSKSAMAQAYGRNLATLCNRLKRGVPLKDALEMEKIPYRHKNAPKRAALPYRDHTGKEYPTISAMARAYGRDQRTLCHRLERGVPLKDALERDRIPYEHKKQEPCVDHTGKKYPSKTAMARAYGRNPDTLVYRLAIGVPLKDALELDKIPYRHGQYAKAEEARQSKAPMIRAKDGAHGGYRPMKSCTDHEGNEFPSASAMCRYWRIDQATYRARLRAGWDLRKILTTPPRNSPAPVPCEDHKGNKYPSIRAMCEAYGISPSNLRQQLKKGKPLDEILEKAEHTGKNTDSDTNAR